MIKDYFYFSTFKSWSTFMLLLLLVSCYPEDNRTVSDYDLVYTNYSSDFNFTNALTYSLPDGVIQINEDIDGPPEFIDPVFSDAILDNLRQNLNGLGWTEVAADTNPDVIVLASAFDQNFLYYYDFGYWGWYYPGFFPGWGWYYPGYSPGYLSGYSTGTVLIQITDPEGLNADNEIPVVWVCGLNGLLQGSDAYIASRIDAGLDQAFNQPPFNN